MPELTRITVYPVKSLDGCQLERATVGDRGALELDREYAIFDADGEYVNGKATADVHRLDASFDPETHELTIGEHGSPERRTFRLRDPAERDALNDYLSVFFGEPVTVERDTQGGYPDDTAIHGPTVTTTGTIQEIAAWFDLPPANVRRRFRANIELSPTEPFWEDRLFADHGEVVTFSIGDVTFSGVNPCQRCVVPARDPDTGESTEGFRETFVRNREATLPDWTPADRFDHAFRAMLNTDVPESEWGQRIAVGDPVTVGEQRPRGWADP